MPAIESQTAEEEEELFASFYKVLRNYNRDLTLRLELNTKLDLRISKIHFNYSKGDQYVTAHCQAFYEGEIEKLQKHLKEDTLSQFFTDFLDTVGLNLELGLNFKTKVCVIVTSIENKQVQEKSLQYVDSATNGNQGNEQEKGHPVSFRMYVGIEIHKLTYICVVIDDKSFTALNIPGTLIWTCEVPSFHSCSKCQIEINFSKSAGLWPFLTYHEEKMWCSVERDLLRNSNLHLIFPLKDKKGVDMHEKGFFAHCAYILFKEVYANEESAFTQLKAMTGMTDLTIDIAVKFKKIKPSAVKDIVTDLIDSGQNPINSGNLAAFCYFLFQIVPEPVFISHNKVVDEKRAKRIVGLFNWVSPSDAIQEHINIIGVVLEQLYICALEKEACLVGFMNQTLKLLGEEYFNNLIQKVVSNSGSDLQLYVRKPELNLFSSLYKLVIESKFSLLEKILRHLIHSCSVEEYVSTVNMLLKNTKDNEGQFEKLVDSCSQKCSHWMSQIATTCDLKEILGHWKNMQSLNWMLQNCLEPILEKGILSCLKSDSKHSTLENEKEFLQVVLEEPIFTATEGKVELLKLLSKSKSKIRNCVIDLLQDEKFQLLPDDSCMAILTEWVTVKLLLDKKKFDPSERVLKAYGTLNVCLQLPHAKKNENIQASLDKIVLNSVEQIHIKDIMKTVREIEKCDELHKLFQKHVSTILHGRHSKKSPEDIIQDICGVPSLRLRSWLTTNIFKNIVDLLGIGEEDTLNEVFMKALDHSSFWTEIFQAKGNTEMVDSLLKHKPCSLVAKSIINVRQQLRNKQVTYSLVQRLKVKESEMIKLLTCRLEKDNNDVNQKVQSAWLVCFTTFCDFQNNTSLIREIYQTLKVQATHENIAGIIQQSLDFLKDVKTKLEENKILVKELMKDEVLVGHMKEIADYCKLLIKPVKSRVFLNILQKELLQMTIDQELEAENFENDDPLSGATLCVLFDEEIDTETAGSHTLLTSLEFISKISMTCVEKYRQTWTPYFRRESRPLEEFKQTFGKIKSADVMEQEIKIAEEFCTVKCPTKLKGSLLKFAHLSSYTATVDAVTDCLEIFSFQENVETYMDIVHKFRKLFQINEDVEGDLDGMTTSDMETVFERVEGIRKFISPEVCELLQVLSSSKSLLDFLEEVIDEDIRNLIDAVEEHSEQYVRESTVSDLIEVKRFFFPILKKTYGKEFTDLFSLLAKQLKSGFKNIPGKTYDCMENLHTLRALYKNVANRGERTKEIIENIVNRGKFSFRLDTHVCELFVKYKQDKKTISHNNTDLSDLRSRALLLMNAEDREKTKQKQKQKDELEQFLFLVDTAFNISNMCLQLKESGHFDFSHFELTCDHKELVECSTRLEEEHTRWTEDIASCREKFYYMNFIYPAQLQKLYDFLYNDANNGDEVLKCLQFINRKFKNVELLKQKVKSTFPITNKNDVLQNIGLAVQELFNDYMPAEVPLSESKKAAKITDMVQDGIPYIAALEEGSPLVLRTLLALYINTTNTIPVASQILICRNETSVDDINLFLGRCVGDRLQHLYTIANIEMLSNFAQNKFVEALHQLPQKKYLLAVICCGNSHHPFLDQFSDRLSHPTPITEPHLKECLRKHWPGVLVVSSDLPGLGKTELVHRRAREKQMSVASLHVSGTMDIQTIIHNLNLLIIRDYQVLHLDIGMTDSASALDSLFFQLIVLGHLQTSTSSYTLTTNHIMIEISNTVGQTLCNSLPTTTSFRRVNIDWSNYSDMKVSTEVNSPVQVVCHYLKALDAGMLDRTDLYFTGPNSQKPLKLVECVHVLEKYFFSASDMSYTLLQIFLKVLSDQLKKLSSSVFFRTANIAAMVGDKTVPTVKSNLVKALLNASQEFACRSVKSCRSLQAASMLPSSKETAIDVQVDSAEELAQRVSGMIRWEDSNHLMVLFHQNVQTVSAIYRDRTKIPEAIQKLFKSQMQKELDEYKTKSQKQLQDILQLLTRSKANKLSDEVLEIMSKDYALTPDNLLKMVLISLRINTTIPVVIMGETGCGKTSLVRYLAKISDVEFEVLSIHAGVVESVIIDKVKEVNDKALSHLEAYYWLFLDEINTCDHLGLISSIICHRYVQNETLAPNMTVIAACNPYRLRTKSTILTAGLQSKVKTDELSRLVYRVHPLPEALIDFVWDYGSLNENDEKFYISKMVNHVFVEKTPFYGRILTDILAVSQNAVRAAEQTDSCVSLRDVDRCKKLVVWFLKFLKMKKTNTSFSYGNEIKAIVLALAVCYHSRFGNTDVRTKYRQDIAKLLSKEHMAITPTDVLKIIREEQDDILNRMVLPSGIAKNTALQENVFVVLVCILNKIPIFLVGKPGCSKSLSMQLIRSNLRGKDSKDSLFKKLPQLFCVSFQGSESSTSDGILKVFEKAEKYQKHNEKDDVLSVVILDEIGLAEISRFNPLKVLHGLLEPANEETVKVAVVGISNWALDAAKMNRAVHLSRPDMDLEELQYTGHSISSAIVDEMDTEQAWSIAQNKKYALKVLKHLFDEVANAYYKYITERQNFPNFHGLRDYYSLVKFIGRHSETLSTGDENFKADIILNGIERNFGGLPTEMAGIVQIFQELFPELKHKILSVTDLIKDNLNDGSSRHLMLITNGDSVISVLESHLNETKRPFEIIFGSHFDDDLSDDYNYRILSRIILCMEQGLVLILKGLESIYGSLYDMLNQNYTIVGHKKNCRIALGHYSNPMCHVHDAFKCIVLVEETKLDYSDPPFLNRFEKQQFRFSDLVENENFQSIINEIEQTVDMFCHIEGYMFQPEQVIPSYNRDLIVSLVLHLHQRNATEKRTTESYVDTAFKLLLWIIPPEVVIRATESRLSNKDPSMTQKMIDFYMKLPIQAGFSECLGILLNSSIEEHIYEEQFAMKKSTNGELFLFYTYTNIHVNIKLSFDMDCFQIEKLSSIKSEKQLSHKVEDFFHSGKSVLLLQCSATYDSQHLLLTKVIIENIRRKTESHDKHVCMIIHLDRSIAHEQQYVPINYLSGWKIVFLDSLEKPLTTVSDFMQASKYEVVQTRRPLNDYIIDNLFWALTRIKFTEQTNTIETQKKLIDQLRQNAFAIDTFEGLIMKWIEEETPDNSCWCIDVAKDTHELYKAGTFVAACENSIHAVIKTPLAMYLYQMLEMQLLSPVFVEDEKSVDRLAKWKDIVQSETYTSIKEMPEITGPECYMCSSPFLYLKMPLSYVLMTKVNAQKEDFIELVRKIRIQNDIEYDEDIPSELFKTIVSECSDIICVDVDDIYNIQYAKREDDYVHDFCNLHFRNYSEITEATKGIRIFRWAVQFFAPSSTFQSNNLIYVMSCLHAALWLNGPKISSICHLLQLSEQSKLLTIENESVTIENKIASVAKAADIQPIAMQDDIKSVTIEADIKSVDMEEDIKSVALEYDIKAVALEDDIKSVALEDDIKSVTIEADIKSVDMEEDIKSVALEYDIKAVALEDDIKSVALEDDIKSVAFEDDIKSLALEDDIKSLAMKDAIKSVALEDDIQSVALDDDIKSVALEDDKISVALDDDIKSVDMEDDTTSVALEDDIKPVAIKDGIHSVTLEDDNESIAMEDIKLKENQQDIFCMSREEIVDYICLKLLPTKITLTNFGSLNAWVDFVNVVIPVARVVTYESTVMPALQLCHEIGALVASGEQPNNDMVMMIGEFFVKCGDEIDLASSFDLIMNILNSLQQNNHLKTSQLHRFFCYFILRCLIANPSDIQLLDNALNMVTERKTFDQNLTFFGKCLNCAVVIDSCEEDMKEERNIIEEIILDNIEELPPFIEILDVFLRNIDVSVASADVVPSLLIDVVEKSCLQHMVEVEYLLEVDSMSHPAIECLSKSADVLLSGEISFKLIAAIAFLKTFLRTFFDLMEHEMHSTIECAIVTQHVNILLQKQWSENIDVRNPTLIYLLKQIALKHGIESVHKRCKLVQNTLTCFENIKWDMPHIELSVLLNPLSKYMDVDLQFVMRKQIETVLEKENTLSDLLDENEITGITLLGILLQRFFMRKWLKELQDKETRMGFAVNEIVEKSKMPSECKHIVRYLVGKEFGHELFSISETSKAPDPQVVSVVLHLCCIIATSAEKSSLWYTNLCSPSTSFIEYLPSWENVPTDKVEDIILHVLNIATVLGSIGLCYASTGALEITKEAPIDPSIHFENTLLSQIARLQELLQLNCSDLCVLLHFIISECKMLITHGSDVTKTHSIHQRKYLEAQFTKVIKDIVDNRWAVIHQCKLDWYISNNGDGGTVALIEEISENAAANERDVFTLKMFRNSRQLTKEMLFKEIKLCSENDFPFLQLVIKKRRTLEITKVLPYLTRWCNSVVTYANYKFRKADFRNMTVQRFFTQEIDDTRRTILKRHFENFKKSWNKIRDQHTDLLKEADLESMNPMANMETCTVWNDDSPLLHIIKKLVDIHNCLLYDSEKISKQKQSTIKSGNVSVLDVKSQDVVQFSWKDDWLNFCQCGTEPGMGMKVIIDFEMIEEEMRKDVISGKRKIEIPLQFPKPIFTDDLYQNSVALLNEIEERIPQHPLTNEIRKSVEAKLDRDPSFVTDLMTHLGMGLALLRKTGGDNGQPLIEYLEKWQSVTAMNSNIVKRILPEPVDSVKLGHVINLYKWLEELNGITLVETLDERYHKNLPQDAKDMLNKIKNTHMVHLEKLEHPLLVFVHRYLSTKNVAICTDHTLFEYIDNKDLWWKGDLDEKGAIEGPDKLRIPLTDVLSPMVLVENVFDIFNFIRQSIQEAKEVDIRITNISTEFQKSKKVLPTKSGTRKNTARRMFKI